MSVRMGVTCISLSAWVLLSACGGDDSGSVSTDNSASSTPSTVATESMNDDSSAGAGGTSTGTPGAGGTAADDLSGAPAVDPTKDVGTLTDLEKAALCDWSVEIRGGYGHETDCGNNITMRTHANQEVCMLIEFPTDCGLTVLEWELCANAQVTTNGCIFPPECEVVQDC